MQRLIKIAALSLMLAGCGKVPTAPGAGTPQEADKPATSGTDVADLSTDVVAYTNEPFFEASVEGDHLVLNGVDVNNRRMAVEHSAVVDGARTVVARDSAGNVDLRVNAQPCQDDMSGARFPFSAELRVDGKGPYRGCARPASMPQPGEPDDEEDTDEAPAQR